MLIVRVNKDSVMLFANKSARRIPKVLFKELVEFLSDMIRNIRHPSHLELWHNFWDRNMRDHAITDQIIVHATPSLFH